MADRPDTGSVRDVLVAVMRQRRFILAVYAGILVAAVLALFVMPPRYRAATKVLVTSNRVEVSTSAERPTQLSRSEQISREELASQVEILRGWTLVERVVDDLGLQPQDAAPPERSLLGALFAAPVDAVRGVYYRFHALDDTATTPRSQLIEDLRQGVEVNALTNSNVIEIALKDKDAAFAADFVNRLTSVYVDWQAGMQREAAAQDFFTKQSDIL